VAWKPDYVSAAELKAWERIDDAVDDTQLALIVTASSRAVDRHTGRQFGLVAAAEERRYTARWDRRRCRWVIEIDDIMSTTGLTFTVEAGQIDTYDLEPINAAQEGRPWERVVVAPGSAVQPTALAHGVTGDGLWGWSAVPATVKLASRLQSARFVARRDSPYGVAGSPELGSELRLLAKVDPDVGLMLGEYVRWWAAA
jgi:hypothetical protein